MKVKKFMIYEDERKFGSRLSDMYYVCIYKILRFIYKIFEMWSIYVEIMYIYLFLFEFVLKLWCWYKVFF